MIRVNWDKYFKDLKFDESLHRYTVEDKQFVSVTTFIDSYKTKIFTDEFVKTYADKHNLNVEYVKEEWRIRGLAGSTKGTCLHWYVESFYRYGIRNTVLKLIEKEVEYFDNFIKDHPYLKAIKNEYRVYDLDYMIAGTIDFIAYDLKEKKLYIIDWKSNSKISDYNRTKMKTPLNNVFQSDLNCYGIQLCLYKIILEKNIPELKIDGLQLVSLNEANSNYVKYDIDIDKVTNYTNKLLQHRLEDLEVRVIHE